MSTGRPSATCVSRSIRMSQQSAIVSLNELRIWILKLGVRNFRFECQPSAVWIITSPLCSHGSKNAYASPLSRRTLDFKMVWDELRKPANNYLFFLPTTNSRYDGYYVYLYIFRVCESHHQIECRPNLENGSIFHATLGRQVQNSYIQKNKLKYVHGI